MKRLIIILLSTLSLTAFAQKKVAVYMTGEDSGVNKVLGDQLVAAFARSGKYIAVERTASFLAELGKEQSYQRTGAVSDNEIAALGIQFGVNFVCVADVTEAFGEKYISARLIDVETAEIVNTHNVSGLMNSMSKCLQMANEITENLTKGTFAEQAEMQRAEAEQREKERLRKIEEGRLAKERKLAELKEKGLVDLGLPSGTLWKEKNENGGYNNFFTYDQAIHQFGNRLPSREQLEELKYKCNWIWNGCGYKIIGPNGNFIVLPAAGWLDSDGKVYGIDSRGCYWSSTPSSYYPKDSYEMYFNSYSVNFAPVKRSKKYPVRLVQNKVKN